MGILPQRGVMMTPCKQISQLKVCQLLISDLQVAYPIGFNGCEEPIITSLPESLANGISLTRGKSIYLEIDIPQSLADEPDQKVPPIGEFSSIIMDSPHKATTQIRRRDQHDHGGRESLILSDVGHACSWVQELNSEKTKPSGCPYTSTSQAKGTPSGGGYLIPGKHPREGQDGRGISRGVPTTISPIAVTTRSESITPPTDAAELWENANKALKELLAMKASIDAHRWRAVWELGMELHQNESKATESLKEANAICSHDTQDAEALCFTTVRRAKVTYAQTSKRPRSPKPMPSGRLKLLTLWPSGILRPKGPPRPNYSRGNMAKSCETWRSRSSNRKATAKVTSSLLARLPYTPAQQSSKAC